MGVGNAEGGAPAKTDKPSSPAQEHSAVPAYPDWTAFQAYYPGMPPPYFGAAVASGHHPHGYMWGPQPLLPPYGSPAYAALYSQGGMYAHHPSMALGPHPHGHVVPTAGASEVMGISNETPKPSNGKEHGLIKKLKGFDGLAVSIGHGNLDGAGDQSQGQSESGDSGTEGSSDRSDGSTAGRKRIAEKDGPKGKSSKSDPKVQPSVHGGESNVPSSRILGSTATTWTPANKVSDGVSMSSMTPGMEFRNLAPVNTKIANGTPNLQAAGVVVPSREGLTPELWLQDERELKRERRKQSNRESARRSRLRKQAETEELAMKVESLTSENIDLKEELDRLRDRSEKLKQENAALLDKVKKVQLDRSVESQPVAVENFLSRINNPIHKNRGGQREGEPHEAGSKLHQLLEPSSRTDPVVAS